MSESGKRGELKRTSFYVINSLKFYQLKNYVLARIIFAIILLVSLTAMLLPADEPVSLDSKTGDGSVSYKTGDGSVSWISGIPGNNVSNVLESLKTGREGSAALAVADLAALSAQNPQNLQNVGHRTVPCLIRTVPGLARLAGLGGVVAASAEAEDTAAGDSAAMFSYEWIYDWVTTELPSSLAAFLISIVISLASAVYMYAYIMDIKGKALTTKEAFEKVGSRILPLAAGAVLYFVGIFAGIMLLVIPGIVFYLTYLFYPCFILEKDLKLFKSFKASAISLYGFKRRVLGIHAVFVLFLFFPMFFLITLSAGLNSRPAFYFVFYFLSTVTTLMQQRLIVLLYLSLVPVIPEGAGVIRPAAKNVPVIAAEGAPALPREGVETVPKEKSTETSPEDEGTEKSSKDEGTEK